MKKLFFLFSVIAFSACSLSVKLDQSNIQTENGYQVINIREVKSTMSYYGDYRFHDFDKKFYPTVRVDFLKDLKKLNSKKVGKMLYAGHTSIRPIFASTAILYHQKYDVKSFIKQLKKELITDYEVTNIEFSPFGTKAGEFYQLTYSLQNPTLKIKTQHVEYIGILKEKTIRILFWTTDSNEQAIFRETEAILKTLSMEWY